MLSWVITHYLLPQLEQAVDHLQAANTALIMCGKSLFLVEIWSSGAWLCNWSWKNSCIFPHRRKQLMIGVSHGSFDCDDGKNVSINNSCVIVILSTQHYQEQKAHKNWPQLFISSKTKMFIHIHFMFSNANKYKKKKRSSVFFPIISAVWRWK